MKKLSSKAIKRITVILAFIAVFIIALIVVFDAITKVQEVDTFSMGSHISQRVYGSTREEAAKQAANDIAKLDDLISWRIEGSDIERLNINAGEEAQEIDSFTYSLLELSKDVSETSSGAFDVTIAPLSRLWNFDENKMEVPDKEMIDKAKSDVNYENIILRDDGTAALKTGTTQVDLGAVGKGAACDVALNVYKETGARAAIVSAGGSIGVYGAKPFSNGWRIAVRDPKGENSLGIWTIKDGFVSTSGNYEKTFICEGKAYHHILDPKTGFPAESGLTSVTVKSSSGALSDALSTACFVLGLDKGAELLKIYDASGIFVTEADEIYLTDEAQDSFEIINESYEVIMYAK